MPKLTVNGKETEFEQGMTLLQACEVAGEEIPRFCYHERLKIAGNCRMCLVQVEGGPPKPAASCAIPAADGMVVHTNSPMVKKAREGVMEFLLINHPLDCPICDQGGECDLQDQAVAYGKGSSRFEEDKRSVKDKYMGPLVKTHMTRCIQCTRCIRFLEDVAGVTELGAVNRGEKMEVTTYVEKSLTSEMSGNIIDLCPVGALTSKPYAYKARPWEIKKTESIDVLDAVGSNIRVDSRGKEVIRILPRLNEEINEEWISDKTRFSYDGLKLQRLDKPYIKENGKLRSASWEEVVKAVVEKISNTAPEKIAAIIGDLADCESIYALKKLMQAKKVENLECRQEGSRITNENRSGYLFNSMISGIEEADICILVGTNPRYEAAIINSRIRKSQVQNGLKVYSIGEFENDFTFEVKSLGASAKTLQEINDSKHEICNELQAAKKPMIIIGNDVTCRGDFETIMYQVNEISKRYNFTDGEWNGINILHQAASRVGALDIDFLPKDKSRNINDIYNDSKNGKLELIYSLGADELDFSRLKNSFIIYQGHHGDKGAHNADIILPGAAYTEKNASYVNTEGRLQESQRAIMPLGEAAEDWRIIDLIARKCELGDYFDSLNEVREAMVKDCPALLGKSTIIQNNYSAGSIKDEPLVCKKLDFYLSNSISRASKIMAKCADEIGNSKNEEKVA